MTDFKILTVTVALVARPSERPFAHTPEGSLQVDTVSIDVTVSDTSWFALIDV